MNRIKFKILLKHNNITYNKLIGIKNSFDIEQPKNKKHLFDHVNIICKKITYYSLMNKNIVNFEF